MEPQTQLFGRFRLLELLGVGGMAEVFLAKLEGAEGFERKLAIKRILPSYSQNDSFVQMFIDEAKLVGHFNHPNIVQVHDFGKIDGSYYISMEYVEGINIANILTRYKAANMFVPLEMILEIGLQAARGIDYAHREVDELGRPLGIIHRDLTPHNILISKKGIVKITDFGIAKASMNTHMTQAGMIKGKVPYMSPEQAMGLPLTHVSDIFAIGIVLYEMCTLRRLFDGENDFTILRKVQEAKIPSITEQNPNIPPELEALIRKALARERTERYAWASELETELTRLKFQLSGRLQSFTLAEFVQRFMATQPPRHRPLGATPSAAQIGAQVMAQTVAPDPNRQRPASPSAEPPRAVGAAQMGAAQSARSSASNLPTVALSAAQRDESLSALAAGLGKVDDPLSILRQANDDDQDNDVRSTVVMGPRASTPRATLNPSQAPANPATVTGKVATDDISVRDTVKNARQAQANTSSSTGTQKSVAEPTSQSRRNLILGMAALVLALLGLAVWLSVPKTGTVVMEVSPQDAEIFFDKVLVGKGPAQTRDAIENGRQVLIEVKKEGYKSYERQLTIEGGVRYRVPVTLEALPRFADLMLESTPPGARVLLDGKSTEWLTPIKLQVPADNPYPVTLELEGYAPRSETFTLKADEQKSASLALERLQDGKATTE
ncbi:MAG: protein kinase domain-containing protein [Myxococcota bacterium]